MRDLSEYTPARVNVGLAGDSLPTKPLLDFRLAHARAKDAVYFPLDSVSLSQEMMPRNWRSRVLHSNAANRQEYLRRPDKGRTLDDVSAAEVAKVDGSQEIVFVVADGLSALAVHRHAVRLLEEIFHRLSYTAGEANPIWIVQQGRVAIGDHIGGLLAAEVAVVIIGERPGLSAPDSLGVYLTWQPRLGRTDAERNCISNIQPQGLSYELAAYKLVFLIDEARRRKLSGIRLKETATITSLE
ncbi:MAG: ethanolamine ammonia-lyase subunit EutC [Acidobacteria bacterium]|nr:ethanolamine ammonia-lyase subunit EutC [Acidobacteriota bacterium]